MYNRLPQGWNSSSGIFHDIVRRCLEAIDGVDDILVGGRNPQEHDEIIRKSVPAARNLRISCKLWEDAIQKKRGGISGFQCTRRKGLYR